MMKTKHKGYKSLMRPYIILSCFYFQLCMDICKFVCRCIYMYKYAYPTKLIFVFCKNIFFSFIKTKVLCFLSAPLVSERGSPFTLIPRSVITKGKSYQSRNTILCSIISLVFIFVDFRNVIFISIYKAYAHFMLYITDISVCSVT